MYVLSNRIQGDYPSCMRRDRNDSIRSSIIEHLVNTSNSIKVDSTFKVIYKPSGSLLKAVILSLLSNDQVSAIHIQTKIIYKRETCAISSSEFTAKQISSLN